MISLLPSRLRRLRAAAFLVAIHVFLAGHPGHAIADWAKIVGAAQVNLRSQPGADSRSKGSIEEGEVFEVLGRRGSWIEIERSDGTRGFVYQDFVQPVAASEALEKTRKKPKTKPRPEPTKKSSARPASVSGEGAESEALDPPEEVESGGSETAPPSLAPQSTDADVAAILADVRYEIESLREEIKEARTAPKVERPTPPETQENSGLWPSNAAALVLFGIGFVAGSVFQRWRQQSLRSKLRF